MEVPKVGTQKVKTYSVNFRNVQYWHIIELRYMMYLKRYHCIKQVQR